MPVDRTSITLAQRVDVGFPHRPNRLRRWRRALSWSALAVGLLWPAVSAMRGQRQLYEAGEVSQAHQLWANDCRQCHLETWAPAARLVTFDAQLRSTPDEACSVCHAGAPHHAARPELAMNCADCHQEHRGHDALALVADRFCTRCHQSLETASKRTPQFAAHVDSFSEHPEFALLRPADETSSEERPKRAFAEVVDGRWRDRTPLRFNHAKHLAPQGLLLLDGSRKKLACGACHEGQAHSGEMRPIRHDRHCAKCHDNELQFDSLRFAGRPVPHGPAEQARAAMIELYSGYLAAPRDDEPEPLPDEPVRAVPGQPPVPGAEGWQWVQARVAAAGQLLFGRHEHGCRYCHDLSPSERRQNLWQVEPPHIPDRWLVHSVFRHDSHRLLSCTACHGQVEGSSQTADILLPSIESCRQCHASAAAGGKARGDCVECHQYHHGAGDDLDGPFSLDLQLSAPAKSRRPWSISGRGEGAAP